MLTSEASLPGVEIEQQKTFLVEAQFDRAEIGQGMDEESCRHSQHERDGDLRDDQHVAEADTKAEAPRSCLRSTGRNFFSAGVRFSFVACMAGTMPENNAADNRNQECESQNVPVHVVAPDTLAAVVSEQPRDEANSPQRDQQTKQAAGQGEQHTLREKLPTSAAAGAETEADRHLAPPCRGARQEQIGNISVQAMVKIRPTIVIKISKGFEY